APGATRIEEARGVRATPLIRGTEKVSDTIQFVARHGYLLIFFWLLAEQAALPLPSLPLLLVSGALARTGQLNLLPIVTYAFVACVIADNVWFQLGRRYGARALQFICKMSVEPD